MSTQIAGPKLQTTDTIQNQFITGSVTSKDGTTIGYRQIGRGPGVVLVHGAMETSQSHAQLAEALAYNYTVYAIDRRGRGMSGPFGSDYSVRKEVEDLDAVLAQTGASRVFGVSAGGVVCLHAALALPAIQKAALFEPALSINGSISTVFVERYDREIAQGKVTAALVTGMKGTQMGPPIFNLMPRWLLEFLTKQMTTSEDKKAKSGDVTWSMLAPTLHYDFQLVLESEKAIDRFAGIRAEVLLLGGSESPAYLKFALGEVVKLLPKAGRVEFPGLNHGASGNADRGGKPEVVAKELLKFYA